MPTNHLRLELCPRVQSPNAELTTLPSNSLVGSAGIGVNPLPRDPGLNVFGVSLRHLRRLESMCRCPAQNNFLDLLLCPSYSSQ